MISGEMSDDAGTGARSLRGNLCDSAALGASALCLVHCLLLPIVLVALPGLGSGLGTSELVHVVLILVAVPVSGYALVEGRRQSGSAVALLMGLAGLALLTVGVLAGEAFETRATVVGSLLLAVAHVTNWRLRNGRRAG